MITRKDYLENSTRLHHDYYSQFVTPQIISYVVRKIDSYKLFACADQIYFNDISLNSWDRLEPSLKLMVSLTLLKETEEVWSLSTAVCIAKAAARIYLENLRES